MGNRRDHVIPLVGIGIDIAANGIVCRNIGDIQAAAMPYPAYMDACDEIGIPDATCIVQEQYEFTAKKRGIK